MTRLKVKARLKLADPCEIWDDVNCHGCGNAIDAPDHYLEVVFGDTEFTSEISPGRWCREICRKCAERIASEFALTKKGEEE